MALGSGFAAIRLVPVERGRDDLDVSRGPALDLEARQPVLEDIAEQASRGKMPLASYRLLHPAARLSEEDRDASPRGSGADPGGRP